MSTKALFDAFRDYISTRTEAEFEETFRNVNWNVTERSISPKNVSVSTHLDSLAEHVGKGEQRLLNEFVAARDHLQWLQTYTEADFGADFINGYGFVEIIGPRGHFPCDDVAAGLVMFGPNITYPRHKYVVEGLFIPLTNGAHWSMDDEPYFSPKAGDFIYHESNTPHLLKTEIAPQLILWVLRNGDLTQKPDF